MADGLGRAVGRGGREMWRTGLCFFHLCGIEGVKA